VNEQVQANVPVSHSEMDLDEALRMGAMALFGEKYGNRVRVIKIGDFSTELCGGTHLDRTGEIGLLKVAGEGAVASGVRRVEAVAGPAAIESVARKEAALREAAELLKIGPLEVPKRLQKLLEEQRALEKQLTELEGYGEISATNAIESIEASKGVPFSRVLFGLNIPKVGWIMAQNVVRHFRDVDRLLAATQEEIEEVEGIGPERAEILVEWFADDQNRELVRELRKLGLRFEAGEEERPVEGVLTGKAYVITGTLEGFSRDEARAALEAKGAKVTDAVIEAPGATVAGRVGPVTANGAPVLNPVTVSGAPPTLRTVTCCAGPVVPLTALNSRRVGTSSFGPAAAVTGRSRVIRLAPSSVTYRSPVALSSVRSSGWLNPVKPGMPAARLDTVPFGAMSNVSMSWPAEYRTTSSLPSSAPPLYSIAPSAEACIPASYTSANSRIGRRWSAGLSLCWATRPSRNGCWRGKRAKNCSANTTVVRAEVRRSVA